MILDSEPYDTTTRFNTSTCNLCHEPKAKLDHICSLVTNKIMLFFLPTQHSIKRSWASLATRTSGGNISLMILVIVAARKESKISSMSPCQNPTKNYYQNRSGADKPRARGIPFGSEASSFDFPTISIGSIAALRSKSRLFSTGCTDKNFYDG